MRVDEDPTKSPNAVRPEGTKSRLMSDEDCSRIIRLINDHCTAHATRPRLISPLAQLPVFDNEANPVCSFCHTRLRHFAFPTRWSRVSFFRGNLEAVGAVVQAEGGEDMHEEITVQREALPDFLLATSPRARHATLAYLN